MKKLFYYAVMALTAVAMTSCDDKDEPTPNPDAPTKSAGAFVLCQGNFYNNIEGGLFALDYSTSTIQSNVFKKANGVSLGDTPQCGICYGSKIYTGIYVSNTIEVLDKASFKSLKHISLNGSNNGTQPRSVVAANGKVYFAMYDGYIARMDTTTMEIEASVKVGPNPEIIGLYNNKIYVPNSDGMNYPNYGKTASVVDLDSFKVVETIDVPENPYQFAANETGLYLLSKGNYNDIASKIYKMEGKEFREVAPATIMCLDAQKIYMVNDPFYGAQPAEYKVYEPSTNKVSEWNITRVDYPSNIAVDKVSGKIFISSYIMNGPYPSYDAPGYLMEYNSNYEVVKKYNIGSGPTSIFFNQD